MSNKNDWKRVEEELPEYFNSVLCCNMNGISLDEQDPVIGVLNDDGVWTEPWHPWAELTVTHWQYLPDLPEEDV